MAVTPSGDGVAWPVNAPDVDQPAGLAWRGIQHLFVGINSRMQKEHQCFTDATAGGEHLPGGCNVCCWSLTALADISGFATHKRGGIAYMVGADDATASFWYYNDSTKPIAFKFSQASICKGGDFSQAGYWNFDGSVAFRNPIEVSSADFTGTVKFDCTVDFSKNVTFNADSTVMIKGQVDVTGIAGFFGDITKKVNSGLFSDLSSLIANDWTFYTNGDGFLQFDISAHVADSQECKVAIKSDSAPNATTVVARSNSGLTLTAGGSGDCDNVLNLSCPVKKDWYFCVSRSGDVIAVISNARWVPIGAAACFTKG